MAADRREPAEGAGSAERLDSWKEIAAYLKRHVTTVRRWERSEGLPVHRHTHEKLGSVYAFRRELDEWWRSRRIQATPDPVPDAAPQEQASTNAAPNGSSHRSSRVIVGAMAMLSVAVLVSAVFLGRSNETPTVSMGAGPEERVTQNGAVTMAHQEYLVGRYHLWRDNDENLQLAIRHFERATALEPQYAQAYASLAQAWWKRGLWTGTLAATEEPARAAARRALAIDDRLPDAYVVMADLERLYGRELVRAEALVTRALALDPNHTDAHYTYGLLLMTLGRFGEAIAHMGTAEQRDPLSPAIQSDFGRVLYRARRYEDAIAHLNRALELEPRMGWLVHSRLADAYEQLGQFDRAVAAVQQAGERRGGAYKPRLARILARKGNYREAKQLLSEIDDSAPANEIAAVYVALGDHDTAFALLFDRIERGGPGPNFVAVDPTFDRLHSDPRWADLLRRLESRDCQDCPGREVQPPVHVTS